MLRKNSVKIIFWIISKYNFVQIFNLNAQFFFMRSAHLRCALRALFPPAPRGFLGNCLRRGLVGCVNFPPLLRKFNAVGSYFCGGGGCFLGARVTQKVGHRKYSPSFWFAPFFFHTVTHEKGMFVDNCMEKDTWRISALGQGRVRARTA